MSGEKSVEGKQKNQGTLEMKYPHLCSVSSQRTISVKLLLSRHPAEISLLSRVPPEPCVLFLPHRQALCPGGSSAHGLKPDTALSRCARQYASALWGDAGANKQPSPTKKTKQQQQKLSIN